MPCDVFHPLNLKTYQALPIFLIYYVLKWKTMRFNSFSEHFHTHIHIYMNIFTPGYIYIYAVDIGITFYLSSLGSVGFISLLIRLIIWFKALKTI